MKEKSQLNYYIELMKPRILIMSMMTWLIGYGLASGITWNSYFVFAVIGTSLSFAGAAILNNFIDRESDELMERTKERALPRKKISPAVAMNLGIHFILLGVFLLLWKTNLLTAFLALLTAFLYVLVYTPMKRVTWFNTTVGAIPGALPPMIGWAAASGEIGMGAWALFLIMFSWQHPHFYAIAWMYEKDYSNANLKMLSCLHPKDSTLFNHIIVHLVLLVPISLIPYFIQMSGNVYLFSAIALNALFFKAAITLYSSHTIEDARKLLRASVIYLPVLFLVLVLNPIQ